MPLIELSEDTEYYAVVIERKGGTGWFFASGGTGAPALYRASGQAKKFMEDLRPHIDSPMRVVKVCTLIAVKQPKSAT